MGKIWIVKTSVAFRPLFIPRTSAIRDEIISTWLLADPKTVVTMFVFHGYARAGREADDLLMRDLYFSVIGSV